MQTDHVKSTDQNKTLLASFKVARVFGIDICLHISVVVIFTLIVTSLAANVFPSWHPQWTPLQNWVSAFTAGVLFFVSLLIHELSHSVVAQSCGIEISRITLFLFGGLAEMRGEPQTPKNEFLIAGAGPLASFVLAFAFGVLASLSISDPDAILGANNEMDLARLSASSTIFMWLSTINFMLASFNLLPGFPMDGGRLFRALLWWRTGDLVRATQLAARVGSGFGWVFIGLGAVMVMNGNTVNGFWLVLIGWFIRRLAHESVASLLLEQALRGFDVSAIMRTRFEKVPADVSMQTFVDDYLLRSSQQLWPVADAYKDLGFVTLANLNLEKQPLGVKTAQLRDYMQPLQPDGYLRADISARDALARLADQPWPLPVVENDRIVGIIHQADILRWLAIHKMVT